jgi:hypothetical protein
VVQLVVAESARDASEAVTMQHVAAKSRLVRFHVAIKGKPLWEGEQNLSLEATRYSRAHDRQGGE